MISEFRFGGSQGANDEFIELYNNDLRHRSQSARVMVHRAGHWFLLME